MFDDEEKSTDEGMEDGMDDEDTKDGGDADTEEGEETEA